MRSLGLCGIVGLALLSAPALGQTQKEALLGADPLARPATDLAPLSWLAGCWINPRQGKMVWQAPKDGAMRATAVPPLGPGQIRMNGDGLALFRSSNPGFPAVAITRDKAVFFSRHQTSAPRDGAPVGVKPAETGVYGMIVSFERVADGQLVLRQSSSGSDLGSVGPGDRYRRCTVAEAAQ